MKFLRLSLLFVVFSVGVITLTAQIATANVTAFDKASNECLGCHIGEGPEAIHKGEGQTVHIVGKEYAVSRSTDPTLTPVDELNPLLLLIDGNVACVTCHTAYSKVTHPKEGAGTGDTMLSISNDGSALCLACHRK